MKETTEKTTDSIEQTVEKANIRYDIVDQEKQYLAYKESIGQPVSTVESVTLCAEHWYFENLLNNAIKHSSLKNIPEVKLHGVEGKKSVAELALKNRPANADITCCMLDEYYKFETLVSKTGTGFIQEVERERPLLLNFIWNDYCCPVNLELMKAFVDNVSDTMKEGLAYVTFNLKLRQKGGQKKALKDLEDFSKAKKLAKAVRIAFNRFFNRYARELDIRCVYDVVYGGGAIGNTTMITLGFAVNLPEKAIKPIQEDRMEIKNEIRLSNYQAYKKMESRKKWTCGRIGKPKKQKTPEEIRVDMAVYRWESEWDNISKEKKIKVAEKYGVNVRTFRCKVAWYHGKLANRSETKQAA